MDDLHLLMLSENEDSESLSSYDIEERENKDKKNFKEEYFDFYDDIKQPCKHIKEDW